MGLATVRAIVIVSTVLSTAAVTVAFFGGPEVGSAYLITTGAEGKELPRLTVRFSLPLLRIDSASAHERPVTTTWVAIVWLVLLAAPASLAVWSLRAGSPETVVTRWAAGNLVLLPAACLLVVAAVVGLVLPFACL